MAARLAAIADSSILDADRHDWLGLVLSAALPLAVFIIVHGIGQVTGVTPLFFAPFGVPGWVGASLHLMSLPLFGIARWMVVDRGRDGQLAGWWVAGLIAGVIAFPFIVMPLDTLALSIVSVALVVLALGTMGRVAKVNPRAALVMAPGLVWMGVSAFVGMAFAGGWSPPFALANGQSAAA